MKHDKRKDYISWEEYFMGLSLLSSMRSKDPNTQVGACIVDESNKIIGIGYNGFPIGCSDDELPWTRKADNINDTKYPYVVHAEVNAILNSTKSLKGARLFVALFPCNECAKVIIQSGIKEIIFLDDKYADSDSVKASKKMFSMSGVKCTIFNGRRSNLLINFNKIEPL
ncbi:tRNA-specific adenosine deaminase [Candidatus Tiddalikarchaeum anstoanum]|nr:tRNA-specific adenosine deaminase [Candidatus Tiddalikarchaeum anstoanum]